jgi:uncharacterized protein YggE
MQVRFWILLLTAPLTARGQAAPGPATATPQIVTSATAEVELKPDRATLVFTVESRGATAANAGAETARKQRAILDTLRTFGIAADQMSTASIEIHPEFVYPGENKSPRVSGYVARNSLRVEVRNIEQTGALIDAALTKEATGIGSLQFSSSRQDDARRMALENAVTKARAEAEAMAKAAGGVLGNLIELSALPLYERPLALEMSAMRSPSPSAQQATPIAPGQIKISATVTGRWAYSASK